MASSFQKFNDLHYGAGLFVLPNAWNAKSALLLQDKKYKAIATSSMAVADSLGYEDGEKMPFNEYLFVINRILATVKIPLSVDMEMGYGASDAAIYDNVLRLVELGVAGINIEDSTITKSTRKLKPAKPFAKTIEYIKNGLHSKRIDLFINVRCDTYILDVPHKQEETNRRLQQYETAGADGIFLPAIYREPDIEQAVAATSLPINVMCIPRLPGFDILNELGVKRVSMGPFLYTKVYDTVGQLAGAVTMNKDFSPISHN